MNVADVDVDDAAVNLSADIDEDDFEGAVVTGHSAVRVPLSSSSQILMMLMLMMLLMLMLMLMMVLMLMLMLLWTKLELR